MQPILESFHSIDCVYFGMYKYNASFFKQDEKYLFRHVLLLTSNYLAYFVIPVTLCNNFFDIRETFSVFQTL